MKLRSIGIWAFGLIGCGPHAPDLASEPSASEPSARAPSTAGSEAASESARDGGAKAPPAAAPEPPPAKGPVLRLVVGPGLRDQFVPLEADAYERAQVGATLELMRDRSGPLCRFKHGLAERDDVGIEAFVSPAVRFVHSKLGAKWSVIAGCWNFVRMNDRRPHRDFEVVRKLVPAADGYECYAVGVLQPYLMSEILGCRTMTMVDFDWQVHAVHWQLLEAWRAGSLAPDALDATLSGLRVDWIAYHSPKERHAVDMHTLCHPGIADRCRATLEAFETRREDASLERITLDLAGLHEIEVPPARTGDHVPVIFLSNATEKHFLTRGEFDQMVARVEAGLLPGQRAIFVHHVANESTFGVYELVREETGSRLGVLCRDEYRKGHDGGTLYETWFETRLGATKKVRACKQVPV